MHTHMKKFLLKISAITIISVLILNIWDNLLNASVLEKNDNNNQLNFKNINTWDLGKVWVALTTKVWITWQNLLKWNQVFSGVILESKSDEILLSHMTFIKDYFNFLKTDVKNLIQSSYDKSDMLQAYIDQIEIRYRLWIQREQDLITKRDTFISDIESYSTQIESLKQKISYDFHQNDAEKSLENIAKYLELNTKLNNAKIYANYINNFIQQYDSLNNYWKNMANVILINKDAIIKDSYVVVPQNLWIESLKQFNLLYEEWDQKP